MSPNTSTTIPEEVYAQVARYIDENANNNGWDGPVDFCFLDLEFATPNGEPCFVDVAGTIYYREYYEAWGREVLPIGASFHYAYCKSYDEDEEETTAFFSHKRLEQFICN